MAARGRDWSRTFPILRKKTYLASHSLGAVPAAAAKALQEYFAEWAAQGIQAWDGPWWETVGRFASRIESVLGAPRESVVPFPNATRAMAAAASALDWSGPRNKVVMTDLEFTTFYPFWRGQERRGARLEIVASSDGITVPAEDVARAIDGRTLLVATCHVYFRSGAVQDLRRIVEAAHARGAYVLGDGYQAVGTLPVDVERLGVDFYVGGCHKYLCGGPGAGFLYVRPDLVATLRPALTGWFGLKDPFAYLRDTQGADPAAGVMRFLDGTPNVPGLYAAREGVGVVLDVGVEAIRRASLRATQRMIDRADELGLEVRTPRAAQERGGMVCLQFPGSKEATQALVQEGIVVDWRPDCGLRASPHFYNSDAHVDRLFDALQRRARPRAATSRAAR